MNILSVAICMSFSNLYCTLFVVILNWGKTMKISFSVKKNLREDSETLINCNNQMLSCQRDSWNLHDVHTGRMKAMVIKALTGWSRGILQT